MFTYLLSPETIKPLFQIIALKITQNVISIFTDKDFSNELTILSVRYPGFSSERSQHLKKVQPVHGYHEIHSALHSVPNEIDVGHVHFRFMDVNKIDVEAFKSFLSEMGDYQDNVILKRNPRDANKTYLTHALCKDMLDQYKHYLNLNDSTKEFVTSNNPYYQSSPPSLFSHANQCPKPFDHLNPFYSEFEKSDVFFKPQASISLTVPNPVGVEINKVAKQIQQSEALPKDHSVLYIVIVFVIVFGAYLYYTEMQQKTNKSQPKTKLKTKPKDDSVTESVKTLSR